MKAPYEISKDEIVELIEQWIHNERNRQILYDREINHITYERLAEKYDLSDTQIKRIVYHGQTVIFSHLRDRH